MAKSACVSPTQHNVSWPMGSSIEGSSGTARVRLSHPAQRILAHRELHRRPHGQSPHAPPPPSAAFGGP
eukprot:2732385-Pyramimonas_sp.AAC.1